MAYRVVMKMGGSAFFVPMEVTENLKLCSAAQLRVLLFALSRNFSEVTPEIIAAKLGGNAEDAKDQLDYWVNRGILECDDAVTKAAVPLSATQELPIESEEKTLSKATLKAPDCKFSIEEALRLKNEDPSVAFVLSEAERILGKTFTRSDTESIVWLTSWAGVPPEVLVTVMEYCAGINKRNLRYIQKTALEWLDSGIDNVEAAEERIHILNESKNWEGCVKHALEIYGRSLVSKEKEYAENWRIYKFSEELIHFAYEKCIEQTAKLSFPYINKILQSWHKKGIKTVEEASLESKPNTEKEAPSFNLDELERRMMLEDSVL